MTEWHIPRTSMVDDIDRGVEICKREPHFLDFIIVYQAEYELLKEAGLLEGTEKDD